MSRRAVRNLLRAVPLAAVACAWQPVLACGFHDPSQVRRGMMNWIYPDSLHVGTAVWAAQAAGRLARDELASGDDLAPEVRNRLGYLRAVLALGRLRTALAAGQGDGPQPDLALILLGPMLWSRYETPGTALELRVHADGPAPGDVVVVTEAPVIEALVAGRLAARDAVALGVIRLYGNAADAGRALDRLPALARSSLGTVGSETAQRANPNSSD